MKREMRKKKERTKKKKYKRRLESLEKFPRIFFWYLMFCSYTVGSAPIQKSKYSLENAAHDFSVMARIINGIAIEAGMKSGTISWADMLNDFLGLDSEISLHVLRDEKWEEFETLMNKLIVSEDVRECGANKSCINMSVVSSGIQKLEEMDGFSLKDMDTLLKTFQPLADLKKLYDDTQKSISSMGVIIKQIKMIPKLGANGDLLSVIKWGMSSSLETFDTDSEMIPSLWNSAKTLENLESSFNSVLQYEAEINKVRSKTDIIETMKTELKKIGELRKQFLSDEKVETVSRILKLLLQIGNSEEKKFLTSGLFNGARDIKQIAQDLDDPFFVDVISDGKNVTILKDNLAGVFKMPTELESLETSVSIRKILTKVGGRIQQVEKKSRDAFTDLHKSKILDILLKCMETENFTSPPDSEEWPREQERYNKNKKEIIDFVENLKKTQFPSDKLVKYQQLKEIFAMDVESEKSGAVNSFDFNELKTELQERKKVLESILLASFKEWGKWTRIDKMFDKLTNSLIGTKLTSIIDCTRRGDILANAKKIAAGSPLFSHLSKFSLENQELIDIQKAVSTIQKHIIAFNKYRTKKRKGARYKRRLIYKSSVQLLTLSRSFAGGVKILRDLVSAKESGSTIKMIMDYFAIIDEEIGKLDIRQSYKIKRFWTPKMKKSLQEIASRIKEVEKSIHDRPQRIADFKKIFNSTRSIDLPNLNCLEMLRQLSFLKKPEDVRDALDTFGSLNLDFSSAATKLDVSITALSGIQIVLGDFFKVNNPVITANGLDQTTTEPEQAIPWGIIGGCLFVLLILIGASVGGSFFWKKRSAKKEKKATQGALHVDISKERKQQLKQIVNATSVNSDVTPKTTTTTVTKLAEKAPGKNIPPKATSGKDGPCFVLEKKVNTKQ